MAKRKLRLWKEEDMEAAISAVRNDEMGILLASKTFNVPHTTLQRKARSEQSIQDIRNVKLGRKPTFPSKMEQDLVNYTLEMESRYWGLTRHDIRSLAFQLAEKNKIPHRFSLLNKCAGFRCTGIYPFNKNIFEDSDFIAGQIEDLNNNHITAESDMMQENQKNDVTENLNEISLPETVNSQNTTYITPWEVSPVPKLNNNITRRNNRKTTATVLTKSPYKKALEESIENIQNKTKKINENKKNKVPNIRKKTKKIPLSTKNNKKIRKSIDLDASSSDSDIEMFLADEDNIPPENVECALCKSVSQDITDPSNWMQCLQCDMVWVHTSCLPKQNQIFICESCTQT